MKHRESIKLYLSVLFIFLVFAGLFIAFQQQREKRYKIDTLNIKLQSYNVRLNESLEAHKNLSESTLNDYILEHPMAHLRLTVMQKDGKVIYDNLQKDYSKLTNHINRDEIQEALKYGSGYDINRLSATVNEDFFYSATWFPEDSLFIRTALPYTSDLVQQLSTDQHYIWFALGAIILLMVILYPFARQLDENFAKLHMTIEETRGEQDKLKRELTQNVAHELKTPVATIQGYLETITENPNIDEKTRQQFIERSYAQTRRLSALLQDIQTLNRMDYAPEEKKFTEVDVMVIIKGIERETALQFNERQMTFTLNNKVGAEKIIVNGSQSMLYSVFRNLTDNALAYAGEGTAVTLDIERQEDAWKFTFGDNGTGVSEEHLSRLFERFYRVDKGRSRKMGGTGLGLAIVKNAVLMHGGTIMARRRDGGGIEFMFTIKDDSAQSAS